MATENRLGTERIPSLVMKMSVPMMASMLIQALYNIVDSIFVSHYTPLCLTAVSLAFPLQNLMIGFSVGTGVGINSVISRRLGEKNEKAASDAAHTALFLEMMTYIPFLIIGLFFVEPFFRMYTQDEELIELSVAYARICLCFSFGMFVDICCERIMQASGDSFHPMVVQMTGAVANIILDPIFIFTFDMGISGAAIATVLGQILAMFVGIYFVGRHGVIKIHVRRIRPHKHLVGQIYAVGIPSIIMNSVGTLMVSLINSILIAFSAVAVSVFGVYFKLQSFIFMPVFGLNNGITPILGYNYGAKNKGRMLEAMRFGVVIAVSIMILGLIIFHIFPTWLLDLFGANEEMYQYGIPALRIISLHFPFAAVSIILIASFQAIGYGFASMAVSLIRQLCVLIPLAYILGHFIGVNGVWMSFIFAEGAGLLFALIFFIWLYNNKIKALDGGKENG